MDLFLTSDYDEPDLAAQRDSVVDFARFCLPQVFFYGMFVLVGQILNARGRFGPMMWAPIANNVISVARAGHLPGRLRPGRGTESFGAFTAGQELLLGLGSTARHRRPVPDPGALPARAPASATGRASTSVHTGLGHTLRLGVWTVLFVIVNQIAYTVVVRLASSGTAALAGGDGTGYTIYSQTFLIMMVPHSIVTVSLATAILPRLSARAAERRPGRRGPVAVRDAAQRARRGASRSRCCCRSSRPTSSHVIWGYGAAADHVRRCTRRRSRSSASGWCSSPSTT